MFSSAFLEEQKTLKPKTMSCPFLLHINPSYRISDFLIGSTEMPELRGTLVYMCLAQRPVRALSVCLSMIRIIRGRTRTECHKCQTVHNKDQHSTYTQWCIVLNWFSVIGAKCTFETEIWASQSSTGRLRVGGAWRGSNPRYLKSSYLCL